MEAKVRTIWWEEEDQQRPTWGKGPKRRCRNKLIRTKCNAIYYENVIMKFHYTVYYLKFFNTKKPALNNFILVSNMFVSVGFYHALTNIDNSTLSTLFCMQIWVWNAF